MAGLLNNNFTSNDALGMVGGGLLNLSQNKKVSANNLLQQALFKKQMMEQPSADSDANVDFIPSVPAIPNNQDQLEQLVHAIGKFESGGKYGILGPQTKSGDRAYGQYQVMGANIPAWTQEVLGHKLTPQEFLNNPEAQDAVARAKLRSYLNTTGNVADASSMWFSGRPMRNNRSRDIIGTSVPQYVHGILNLMNNSSRMV